MKQVKVPLAASGLLPPAPQHSSGLGGGEAGILHQLLTGVGVVVALGVLHLVIWHLHSILVPFVLSAFIVLTLQPSVEAVYERLAGLEFPHRWFVCCCPRRRCGATDASSDDQHGDEAFEETTPLLRREKTVIELTEEMGEKFADGFCRFLAVTLVLLCVVAVAAGVCVLICHGAYHVKENWAAYNTGLLRLMTRLDRIIDTIGRELHVEKALDERVKDIYNTFLAKSKEGIWTLVNTIASGLSEGVSSFVLVLLYVLFWLSQPLPTGGKAGALVRSYLYMKTLVSFLYGACVALLFFGLGIDLAVLFGVVSFFLNFVPEVGAFVSMIAPVPVIVLDGRLDAPFLVLAAALLGQLVLKFIFGNVLEVKLIEADQEMNIHPVWVILGLSYFGFVWGPIGMLISVPALALLKTAALSCTRAAMVQGDQGAASSALPEFLLACLEGRRESEKLGRSSESRNV